MSAARPAPTPLASMADLRRVAAVLRPYRGRLPRCILQEVAQEAIARTITRPDVRSPLSYARRTAVNLAIDCLRKQRLTRPLAHHEDMPDPFTDAWSGDRRRVGAVIARAPASYGRLLQRHYLEDEPLEAIIAEEVGGTREEVGERRWGLARDAVYKRRMRALCYCRGQLLAA